MLNQPPREKPARSWLIVGIWAFVIFAAVPFARDIQAAAARLWGKEIFTYLVVLAVLLGLGVSINLVRRHRPAQPKRLIWLCGVACAYLAYTMILASGHPVEAVHFLQYGILSVLIFRALSHRIRDLGIYAGAAVICAMVGIVDEMIQGITPERYWDLRDIWMNFFAGTMAQAGLALGLRPGYINGWPGPQTRKFLCGLFLAGLILLALNLVFIWPESKL